MMFICCILVAFLMCGCQLTPSRANINDYKDCYFDVRVNASTNCVPGSNGDMFVQNMVVETGGSETLSTDQRVEPDTSIQLSSKKSSPAKAIKDCVDCEDCADCGD